MSLCTYNRLLELWEQGVIQNCPKENINAASIDLTLSDVFWIENPLATPPIPYIDLSAKEKPDLIRFPIEKQYDESLALKPGQFCLAATEQVFNMPNNLAGHFLLKSSIARAGLNHLYAGWADPGWNGSVLTLELHNCLQRHALVLRPGMKIGQMVFWEGEAVPDFASYATRGQYNKDAEAQPSKGAR